MVNYIKKARQALWTEPQKLDKLEINYNDEPGILSGSFRLN